MPILNAFIKKLSQLTIDAIKDWAGQRIDNVGAPNTDDDVPRARAADILSGRFIAARLLDGPLGQVITGQGAGIDPAYAAVPTEVQIVRKTADEIVNNSAALQNDDHLVLAAEANSVWLVDFIILVLTPSATPDVKLAITVPAGASVFYSITRHNPFGGAVSDQVGNVSGEAIQVSLIAGETNFIRIPTIAVVGATAGNIQLQWAQFGATAEDTTVKANSCLIAHKLA